MLLKINFSLDESHIRKCGHTVEKEKDRERERESDRESIIPVRDTFNSCQQGNYMGLKLIRGINTSITNDPQERLSFAQSGSYCCLTGRQKVEQESLL